MIKRCKTLNQRLNGKILMLVKCKFEISAHSTFSMSPCHIDIPTKRMHLMKKIIKAHLPDFSVDNVYYTYLVGSKSIADKCFENKWL